MNERSRRTRLRRLILPATLLAASGLVVVLGWQVRSLRFELRTARLREVLPHAGLVVPPLHATTMSGDPVLLGEGPSGMRQVLLVFNTACSICIETLPAWIELVQQLSSVPQVQIIGWSQDPDSVTGEYVRLHRLPFAVVAGSPRKYFTMYHAEAVPLTVVVAGTGRVLYVASGLLDSWEADSVVAAARGSPESRDGHRTETEARQ